MLCCIKSIMPNNFLSEFKTLYFKVKESYFFFSKKYSKWNWLCWNQREFRHWLCWSQHFILFFPLQTDSQNLLNAHNTFFIWLFLLNILKTLSLEREVHTRIRCCTEEKIHCLCWSFQFLQFPPCSYVFVMTLYSFAKYFLKAVTIYANYPN